MPELKDPFIQRVPEGSRSVEPGELTYSEAYAAAHPVQPVEETEASLITGTQAVDESVKAESPWRAKLRATLAEEPKRQGDEYYAELKRFLERDGGQE